MFRDQIAQSYAFSGELIEQCRERYETSRPPGYSDQTKAEPDCFGDALIWLEVLELAARLSVQHEPLAVVTGDFKRDWWQYEAKWRRAPRFELLQEVVETGLATFVSSRPENCLRALGPCFPGRS